MLYMNGDSFMNEKKELNNNFEQEEKSIKTIQNNNISLSQEFSQYKGDNLAKEFEWDEPQGKEIW